MSAWEDWQCPCPACNGAGPSWVDEYGPDETLEWNAPEPEYQDATPTGASPFPPEEEQ